MKRRGSSYYRSEMAGLIDQFKPGDLVWTVLNHDRTFYGVVREAVAKENKVYVAWGGGAVSQHDPDELMPVLTGAETRRMAGKSAMVAQTVEHAENDPQFVGDPEKHGLDTPLSGGFNVMQQLVKMQRKESYENAGLAQVPSAAKGASLNPRRGSRMAGRVVEEVLTTWPDGTSEKMRTTWDDEDDYEGDDDDSFAAAKKVARRRKANSAIVPSDLMDERPDLETVDIEVKGDTITVSGKTKKGKEFQHDYPNEWRAGWHNGVKKMLQTPMGASDKKFDAWVKEKFGVEKPKAASLDFDSLQSRRAMYHGAPGRVYRLKRVEQEDGADVKCPKCGNEGMELEPFTKSEKMYRCPKCGFKVPTGNVITDGIDIHVTVNAANLKTRRGK